MDFQAQCLDGWINRHGRRAGNYFPRNEGSYVHTVDHGWLGIWVFNEWHGHGDAVLRFVRQRGLRRMENRDSRCGISYGHRRGVLPESGQWTWWCLAGVDTASTWVRRKRRANTGIA